MLISKKELKKTSGNNQNSAEGGIVVATNQIDAKT